ncbi:MAG: hypothetical protein LQ350_007162, partial [Teloschistes chrysophthalmus]
TKGTKSTYALADGDIIIHAALGTAGERPDAAAVTVRLACGKRLGRVAVTVRSTVAASRLWGGFSRTGK